MILFSRQKLEDGEWRLHSQVVDLVWQKFERAEVDLFASSTTMAQSVCFSPNPDAPCSFAQSTIGQSGPVVVLGPSQSLVVQPSLGASPQT